jgi:predicted HNH restriction endonuclease
MFEKVLSKNDVGHRGHQSGFLVPKNQAIGGVFPELSATAKNPCIKFELLNWHTGERLEAKFIHYNNKHDEYRVTGLRRWFVSAGLKSGDIMQIKKVSGEDVLLLSYKKREHLGRRESEHDVKLDEALSALEGTLGSAGKRRKRAAWLKKKAAEIHGKACLCCGFTSERRYVGIKKVIIDFHHVHPLGAQVGPVKVRAIDLIPLCPNCHRAVHTKVPPICWKDLRKFLIPSA